MNDPRPDVERRKLEWRPWRDVLEADAQEETSGPMFEAPGRPIVSLSQYHAYGAVRGFQVPGRIGLDLKNGGLRRYEPSSRPQEAAPARPIGEMPELSLKALQHTQFPKWLRAAFLTSVVIEVSAIATVIATPIINGRIITVTACGIAALGLGALSWIASKANEYRNS